MRAQPLILAMLWVGLSLLERSVALGQDFPSKPIRIVTGQVGGGNDIHTRIIAPVLSRLLTQPVVVDNRSGSAISSEAVSRAAPDGYSLLYNGQSMWVNPMLQKTPYDVTEFAPVAQVAREIYILTVHPSLPVKSINELVSLAKARPGQLNYGTSGPATEAILRESCSNPWLA